MRTVFKYSIAIEDGWQDIPLPESAAIVHFDYQADAPLNTLRFWAEVNTNAPIEERKFAIVGTGHPIPDGGVYMATCMAGSFVWHLYENALHREPEQTFIQRVMCESVGGKILEMTRGAS